MRREAFISPCGVYRYSLRRSWRDGSARVGWIMLNPSTADATQDDATIQRCIAYSRAWGADSLEVVNLFAYRATNPKELLTTNADPVGRLNDVAIRNALRRCYPIICAWGAVKPALRDRVYDVYDMLAQGWHTPHALQLTKDGDPHHPLRLAGDLQPQRWTPKTAGVCARCERYALFTLAVGGLLWCRRCLKETSCPTARSSRTSSKTSATSPFADPRPTK